MGTMERKMSINSVNRRRMILSYGRTVMFHLLLLSGLTFQPALAAPEAGVYEIAEDNAVIASPRTTLDSLLRLTDTYHELVSKDGITRENRERVNAILQQINKLFDLRQVPEKYRRNVGTETAIYLREALARFPVPPLEEVPDEDGMVAAIKDGKAALYRLPGTPVVIRKTEAGTFEGRYQFSAATVAEARSWYRVAKTYPYTPEQAYIAGLYEDYFLTPGPMIPVELIRALPDWMQQDYLEQSVWQWLLLLLTVVVLVGMVSLVFLLVKRIARGRNRLQQNLVNLLGPAAVIYLVINAMKFVERQVFITGDILQYSLLIAKIAVLTAIVVLIMRIGNVITELLLSVRQISARQIDQQLIRLGVRMLTILVSVIVVMEGMQKIGFSLATLVAGAGVTGLAIALAAQDTLKNVFGGVLLAMDHPFEVGQRVIIKGYEGHIKQIGLRSIRVRTLKGHELIIPNDEAARIEVENIGRRPYIRRDLDISITYDTPPEKIKRAVEILREILSVPETEEGGQESEPHPNVAINQPGFPPRVFFDKLNADSLNLLAVYWFHPPDKWQGLAFDHWVNMQIMERFNAEGIDFAFPSQTMYLAGDNKRPINLGQQASPSPTAAGTAVFAQDERPEKVATGHREAGLEHD